MSSLADCGCLVVAVDRDEHGLAQTSVLVNGISTNSDSFGLAARCRA